MQNQCMWVKLVDPPAHKNLWLFPVTTRGKAKPPEPPEEATSSPKPEGPEPNQGQGDPRRAAPEGTDQREGQNQESPAGTSPQETQNDPDNNEPDDAASDVPALESADEEEEEEIETSEYFSHPQICLPDFWMQDWGGNTTNAQNGQFPGKKFKRKSQIGPGDLKFSVSACISRKNYVSQHPSQKC